MKKTLLVASLFMLMTLSFSSGQQYIVLGWNDLGMHCANKNFDAICILPPYNNLMAQVIQVGSPDANPKIVTDGIKVEYSIPGNTYSVGKTNFWSYAETLFGVKLNDNIGLKGYGLSGLMADSTDHFLAEGIPVTPYQDNDLINENPYQLARFAVKDSNGKTLAITRNVIPVSNEISCVSAGCHNSEDDIINSHSEEGGFTTANKPIFCAKCHADNALGMPGRGNLGSLSRVIHSSHSKRTSDCYKCHPGPKTKCLRDTMFSKGKVCSDCHGSMAQVANSQQTGRQPWLNEPSCAASGCHASKFAEETGKLYRQSKGHHGIYCSACHGSPHAIVPTVQPNDNIQNMTLQGFSGNLKKCSVCHGMIPQGDGPHGLRPPIPAVPALIAPANDSTGVPIGYKMLWDSLSNSKAWEIQISESEFFTTMVVDTIITSNVFPSFSLQPKKHYFWQVRGFNDYGPGDWSNSWNFTTSEANDVPELSNPTFFRFILNADYSSGRIEFELNEPATISINVINLLGINYYNIGSQKVYEAGKYSENVDLSNIPDGIYFIIFRRNEFVGINKVIISR